MKRLTEIPELISTLIFHWTAIGRLDKLWASNEYAELISFCDLMLSKDPSDYLALFYRGLANEKTNRFEIAIKDLIKSETMLVTYKQKSLVKEYFVRIPIQLSRIYGRLQNMEKAFDYADKAVQANNEEIDGLKWRASLKEGTGNLLGASEDLNIALRRRPNDKSLTKLRDRLTHLIIEDKRERAGR